MNVTAFARFAIRSPCPTVTGAAPIAEACAAPTAPNSPGDRAYRPFQSPSNTPNIRAQRAGAAPCAREQARRTYSAMRIAE